MWVGVVPNEDLVSGCGRKLLGWCGPLIREDLMGWVSQQGRVNTLCPHIRLVNADIMETRAVLESGQVW